MTSDPNIRCQLRDSSRAGGVAGSRNTPARGQIAYKLMDGRSAGAT